MMLQSTRLLVGYCLLSVCLTLGINSYAWGQGAPQTAQLEDFTHQLGPFEIKEECMFIARNPSSTGQTFSESHPHVHS